MYVNGRSLNRTVSGPMMGPLALQERTRMPTVPQLHGAAPADPRAWRQARGGQLGGFVEFWSALGIAADLLRL